MIQFFRHIRQKLLAQGRLSKYLIYAIGEIALVMIGILLALQVNNWNEERKANDQLKAQLSALHQDIISDQERLEGIYNRFSFKYYSLMYLLDQADADPYDVVRLGDVRPVPPYDTGNSIWKDAIPIQYDSAFVEIAFLWSHRIGVYDNNRSAYEELKSIGSYSLIKSTELKNEINEYHKNWDNRYRSVIRELTEEWQREIQEDGVITSKVDNFKDPISLIRNHPKRIAILYRLVREVAFWVEGSFVMTEHGNRILQLIEEEIENL